MEASDRTNKYCVIGAGSSGLAAAKNLLEAGIEFDCLEREDDVGGNWYFGKPHSSVYQSTHLISSKALTEYADFPMPAEYPDFPSHRQVWDYLRSYAHHFGLHKHIEFNTSIERVEPRGTHWQATLADGQRRLYRGVVIANGHNWNPRYPELRGSFSGTSLHSSQYKTPDVLRGRRVLVIGGGNSGCDIAVESAQNAACTFHSLRRGYHYLPKYFRGLPIDECGEKLLRLRLPTWLRRAAATMVTGLVLGPPERYGLPRPDHKLFETHPIINSQMLYFVGHGDIRPKPDVAELCSDRVRFVDGSEEEIDTIVYATGFRISFPFIDTEHLNWRDGRPQLFLNVFHPQHDHLAVCGLIQPDSGQFGLADYQARLIARFFRALKSDPSAAERFRRRKAAAKVDVSGGIHYVNSSRHLLEVEHFSYRRKLKELIEQFA